MFASPADQGTSRPAGNADGGFASSAVDSDSCTVLRDEVAAHSTPHEVTARSSRVSGHVEVLTLPHCRLVFVRYGGEVAVEAPATGTRTVATVPLGPMVVRQGRRETATTRHNGFLLSRTDDTLMHPDAWAGAWVVAADAEQLAGHRRLVLGAAAPAGTEAAATDALDRGDVAEIGRSGLLNDACRQAWALTQLPDATPQPAVTSIVRAIESNLLTALVLSCTIEHSDEDSCGDLRVDMLLDWLRANYQHPITVADMASVAGLSVRQLQSVFQHTVGHSPMAALRTIRMRHAHQMLRSAAPQASTVTSIAYHCGITHPGRFALQYRAEYGESPSETLARRG